MRFGKSNPEQRMGNNVFSSAVQFFLKGVAVSFSGMVLLGIINYLIRRYLVLHLSEVDFGFFYSMFAFFSLLTTFCQFGIKQASAVLTASYAAKHQEQRISFLTSSLLTFTAVFCSIVMIALFFGCRYLASSYFKYPNAAASIMVFIPFIILNPLWSLFLSIPHGKQDFPVYYGLEIFQMILVYIGVLIFAADGIFSLSTAWISAVCIAMLIAWILICRRYRLQLSPMKAFSPAVNRKIWSLCSWMSVSTTGLMLLSFLDSCFLTWLADLKQVAAYNIALPIMQILQSLTVLPLVFLPFSADLWEKKRYREISRIFHSVNLVILACVLPLTLLLHLLGPWIITIMFGKQFVSSSPALTVLSSGVLFYVAGQFNLNLLNATGKQKTGAWIILAVLSADVVLNFQLVPRFGFKGSAIALSSAYLLTALLSYLFAALQLKGMKNDPDEPLRPVKKKKLLLAATSGGHLTEVLALMYDLPNCEYVVFTEETPRLKTLTCRSYSYRRPQSPFWTMVTAFFPLFFIILKERPDWVVTTGAECGTAAVLAGKLLFRKTMFIETASRFRTKTVSARICYLLANRFYVQHEAALKIYGDKAEYIGGVL